MRLSFLTVTCPTMKFNCLQPTFTDLFVAKLHVTINPFVVVVVVAITLIVAPAILVIAATIVNLFHVLMVAAPIPILFAAIMVIAMEMSRVVVVALVLLAGLVHNVIFKYLFAVVYPVQIQQLFVAVMVLV